MKLEKDRVLVRWLGSILFLFALLVPPAQGAQESSQTITVDGRLFSGANFSEALKDAAAQLKIQILDPARACVLYEELQTVNTTSSDGRFGIQVGSAVGNSKRQGDDPGNAMAAIFQNVSKITATNSGCTSGYTPASGDIRYLRITVTPSATGVPEVLSPDMTISSLPNALVSESVQGLDRSKLLEIGTDVHASATQANYTALIDGSDASSLHSHDTQYAKLNASQSISLSAQQTLGLGQFDNSEESSFVTGLGASDEGKTWYNKDTQKIMYWDGTTAQAVGAGAGVGDITAVNTGAGSGLSGGTTTGDAGLSVVVDNTTLEINGSNQLQIKAGSVDVADLDTASVDGRYVNVTGDTMTAALNFGGTQKVTGLAAPTAGGDAVNKTYADANLVSKTLAVPAVGQNNQSIRWNNGGGAWAYYTPIASGDAAGGDLTGTYPNPSIDSGAVTSAHILDGQVDTADLANGAVSIPKLAPQTAGQNGQSIRWNNGAGNWEFYTPATGNVTTVFGRSGVVTAASGDYNAGQVTNTAAGLIAATDVQAALNELDGEKAQLAGRSGGQTLIGGTGASETLTLNSTSDATKGNILINPSGGNVGIGTASPGAQLTVDGNMTFAGDANRSLSSVRHSSGAGGSLTLESAGAASSSTDNNGGTLILSSGTATGSGGSSIELKTATAGASGTADRAPSTKMTILSSGNVGIGTASPSTKLEVNGTVTATAFAGDGSALTGVSASSTADATAINFAQGANRVIDVDRATSGAGNNLSISAGGGQSGGTDLNGGTLTLASGTSTGTGSSSIQFQTAPAAGSGTADNAPVTRMTIDGSGNVGVGTTTPAVKFSVKTDHLGTGVQNMSVVARSYDKTPSTEEHSLVFSSSVSGSPLSPTTRMNISSDRGSPLSFGVWSGAYDTSPNNYLTITSSGDVGIGTTGPGAKLTVDGNMTFAGDANRSLSSVRHSSGAGGSLTLESAGAASGSTDNNGGTLILSSGTATGSGGSSIELKTATAGGTGTTDRAPSTKMTILSSGHVGIGTTAPTEALHIRNDAAGALSSGLLLQNRDATAGTEIGIKFIADGQDESDNRYSQISGIGHDLRFLTADGAAPAERVRILANGNVGIGTAGPSTKLEVSGTVTATAFAGDGSALTSVAATSAADATAINFAQGASRTIDVDRATSGAGNELSVIAGGAQSGATDQNGGNLTLSSGTSTGTGSSSIVFQTAPAAGSGTADNAPVTRMTIDGSGNVGIGTTSPGAKLHVENGGVLFSGTNFSGTQPDQSLLIGQNGNDTEYTARATGGLTTSKHIFKTTNAGTPSNSFVIGNTGITTDVRLDSTSLMTTTNKIGVGTTNPVAELEVNGGMARIDASAARLQFHDVGGTSGSSNWQFNADSNVFKLQGLDDGFGSAEDFVTVDHSGNVGIGTASATHKLQVESAAEAVAYFRSTDTDGGILFGDNAGTSGLIGANGNTWFTTGGATTSTGSLMYIKSNGNIGIGTTSTGAKLHVKGTAGETQLKVNSLNGQGPYAVMFANHDDSQYIAVDAIASGFNRHGNGDFVLNNTATGFNIVFRTESSERMRISNTGNVAIGTTNPHTKLTVEGAVALDELASSPAGTAGYGTVYAKTDGKVYFRNGTGTEHDLTGGALNYVSKTANYTAVAGDHLLVDGGITITLPASPGAGDRVILVPATDWVASNATVARNGSKIQGESEDLTLDVNRGITLVFSGATLGWVVQ